MKCTNYSIDPFKSIVTHTNRAAADYVAALLESDEFQQWYGSTKAPAIKDLKITNAAGKVWDLRETLSVWRRQEEIKLGYRDAKGEPVLYDANKPGQLKSLTERASYSNYESNPFKARVVRRSKEGSEYYTLTLDYNKDYTKSSHYAELTDRPEVEKDDSESFFYMANYDPKLFSEGKKTASIRPELYQEGVYMIGDEFFRVSLRSPKRLYAKDVAEGIKTLRKNAIQEDPIEYMHMQDFFDGKKPMFIYDIQKMNITPKEGKALPDFIGSMATKTNSKAPAAKFLTGYEDIDKYIETLVEAKTALFRQRAAVKKDIYKVQQIDNRIETLNKHIAKLKADAELTALMHVGRNVLFQLQKDLVHATSFTEIDNGLRLAKAWKEIDQVLDFTQENPDEEAAALLKDAEQLRSTAQTLYTGFFNKYQTKLLEIVDAHIAPKSDGQVSVPASQTLLKDGKIAFNDVDYFGSRYVDGSFSDNAMEQLLDVILKKAEFDAQQESYALEGRLDEAVKELTGHGFKQSKAEEFDFLFDKDGRMLTKYDQAFYKQLYLNRYLAFDKGKGRNTKSDNYQAALSLGATAEDFKQGMTPKEYYEWEKKHFKYELSPEGQKAFEDFMEEAKESNRIGYDEANNPIYDDKAIEDIFNEYNPEGFTKYIAGETKRYNKGQKWFTKVLEKAPLNKQFEALTPKQMKFYQYYVGEFMQGQQDMVMDHRFGDVEMDRHIMDFVVNLKSDLGDKLKYLGKNLSESVKSIATVRYFDDSVAKNVRSAITGVERKGVEFRPINEFIKDPKAGKTHPMEVLLQFRKWGHLFKHKREIEDTLNAVKDLSHGAEKLGKTPDGRVRSTATGKVFTSNEATNRYARIAYKIDVALTGQRKEPHAVEGTGTPGERSFSGMQLVDSINNYTRVKNMALSPLSGTGNLLMGSLNNWIYAANGQFYNDKELAHAYWIIKENVIKAVTGGRVVTPTAKKIVEIMRRYSLLGDVTEELYHGSDTLNHLFILQKNGEFLNQGATAIAMMLNKKVKMKQGPDKRMWDLFEMNKEGRLEFNKAQIDENGEMQDDNNLFLFFEKIKKVNQKIHGDYTNAMLAKKDVWGRVLMMFRTWLPMAVKERFGKEYDDELLGKQKGRYRSAGAVFARTFTKDGWLDSVKLLGKMLLPIIGRKIKLSNNVSEVDRQNIMMFARETQFILMITLAILAAKAQIDDEEDEDTKNILRYIYNQGERAQSELMFFFMPKDFMQITRDMAPISGTFQDAWKVINRSANYVVGGDDEYKTGFRKGKSKAWQAIQDFTPVLRGIEKANSTAHQIFTDSRYN